MREEIFMAVYDKLEKLIEKYEEYIRQYEAQKELDEYDQGQYNNLLSAVASLKDIANRNSETYIQTEIVDEMQALKENANGCECCSGDQPLFWQNDENNAFVDSHGEMLVTAKDREVNFQVKFCPNCGRKF